MERKFTMVIERRPDRNCMWDLSSEFQLRTHRARLFVQVESEFVRTHTIEV